MATVKVINNILEGKWETKTVENGLTVEKLIRDLDTTNYDTTLVECYDTETGVTTYEPLSDNTDTTSVIVSVNGKSKEIDYVIKEEDVIELIFTPAGDDWSWRGAWTGAFGGLITGALYGVKWGPYGLIVGAIVGAVIGFVAGGLLYEDGDNEDSGTGSALDSNSLPDIRGSQNQPLTDNNFPAVFGRHLVTPFILGTPYNDIYGRHGETIYINALYLVGYGPLKITDLKLGDQFLAHNQKWSGNPSMQNVFHGTLQGTNSDDNTDSGDIVNTWHANNIEVEILQQGQNGEEIDWGKIYPHAVIQEDIKANVLYIADGNEDEEPIVSYKKTLLQNGLRNNPVKFTRQNPLSAKVELNFPNGLYRSRSKKSNMEYGAIPLWAALQWRVYSDDNISSSGDDNGVIAGELIPENEDYWWDAENNRAKVTKRGWHTFTSINGGKTEWTVSRVDNNSSVDINRTHTFIKHEEETDYDPEYDLYRDRVFGQYNINETFVVSIDKPAAKSTYITFSLEDEVYFSCNREYLAAYSECEDVYTVIRTETYTNAIQFSRDITVRIPAGETSVTITDVHSEDFEFEFDSYGRVNRVSSKFNTKCTNFEVEYSTVSPEFFKLSSGLTMNTVNTISRNNETVISNKGLFTTVFTDEDRQRDKSYHTGNTFPNEINDGWIGAELFNFEALSGTKSDTDGISEFRAVTSVNFEEWARENFTYSTEEEFINMFREYFMPSVNSTKSIEVRVVRVSPCYLDETSGSGDTGPYTYQDVFSWQTLTTTMLDKEHFLKNAEDQTAIENFDVIREVRPLPEKDMRKHCIIALRAKTDNTDQIGQTLKKFNCMAQSFAPYFDVEQKKWFPENVEPSVKYYEPNIVNDDGTVTPGEEITEDQFIEERQNGVKAIRCKNGNDFVKNLVTDVIRTDENIDLRGRYIIPDEVDSTYAPIGKDPNKYLDNNVASVLLYAGIGPHLGINALSYDDFDLNALGKVYEFCEEVVDGSKYNSSGYHYDKTGMQVYHKKGQKVRMFFTANAYIYKESKLEEVFRKLCLAARCVYTRTRNNRLTFIIDKPEKYHVALINQSNTLSSSYTLSYNDVPAGLLIPFADEEDGYETNTLYCMKDGETKDNYRGVIEQYSIDYVTNPYQAWSIGRYLLANRIMNREVITKKIGMEGYSIGLGNIVCVQDDTMLIGTDNGGRITKLIEDETFIYGFIINNTYEVTGELDDDNLVKKGVVVMQPSQWQESRVLTLRLAPVGYQCDVEVEGKLFTVKKGQTNVVILANRIAKNAILSDGSDHYVFNPQIDNIVGFGEIGKESALYRVIKIASDEKHNYELTLLKYQKELYNYGDTLPSFHNNITIPNSSSDGVSISNSVTATDLAEASGNIQNNLESYINAAVEDMQELVENLADNPTVYTSITSCGVAVNDNDIATKTQKIAITFFARQGDADLEFYFPMQKIRSLLPQGYSVEIDEAGGNPHTLILTIAEGTLVTTESLQFFINFTAYKYDFNYADGEETGYYDGADGEYGERTELEYETEYETGFTVIGVQGGRYLGAVTAVGSDYITIKTGNTTEQKAVSSLILGDYFVYQGENAESTLSEEGHFYTSQIYQFLGVSEGRTYMWALDSMSEHIGGTLTDALKVANESLSHNNSDIVQFLDHLTANSIFVDKLVANTILANELFANTAVLNEIFANDIKATGSIRVGDRYDENGDIDDDTKTGAWLGNSGVLKAHKAVLTDVTVEGEVFANKGIIESSLHLLGHEYRGGSTTAEDWISEINSLLSDFPYLSDDHLWNKPILGLVTFQFNHNGFTYYTSSNSFMYSKEGSNVIIHFTNPLTLKHDIITSSHPTYGNVEVKEYTVNLTFDLDEQYPSVDIIVGNMVEIVFTEVVTGTFVNGEIFDITV